MPSASVSSTPAFAIANLRCDYLVNPLGIDESSPRLSWTLESEARGARQLAYRIRVSSTAQKLAANNTDLWDSGRIESDQTTHITYAGKPLTSRATAFWTVEVWPTSDSASVSQPSTLNSQLSAVAHFSLGLLYPADWSARWITHDVEIIKRDSAATEGTLLEPGTPALFRREIDLPAPIARATLYATARGIFEFRANGQRISQDLFAPEWTDYDKRIHYRTYDVTALLSQGRNALAATLGDGWWTGYVGWQETRARYGSLENSLLAQLEVELTDGRRLTFGTDSSWTCNTGPILTSDWMMGETYDARREPHGWDRPNFSPSSLTIPPFASTAALGLPWLPARETAAPAVPLVAQRSEPVRITELLKPVSLTEIKPGVFIYDLAQNISGWARLKLPKLPAGTKIIIRQGERLSPDGTLYVENLRRAKATDTYVARGDSSSETYEPHFTFHGFQFVELTGFPAGVKPDITTVTGCMIQSATPPTGHFECSNADVNRLWLNGLWSQKDNFLSVPTDCPQRDERLGWMGDAQVFLRTASYNMDVAAFFTKWMIDVEDAQTPEGIFPDVAPRLREGENFIGLGNLGGAAAWADAGIIIPHTLWRVYGDRRVIEKHYGAMVKWVDWIASHNPTGLRLNQLANNYGDWLCIPSDTSFGTHSPMKNLLATAYWADDCTKLAEIARELGHTADAARFTAMFEKVRAAFQKEWVRENGQIIVETQTAYLIALAFDLLKPEDRGHAADRLVDNIAALDWHLSTGFVGISHLNPQLTLNGRADVAYKLLLRDDYPSWLYPVKHGATTIWERWNGWTHKDGFFNPHMNSFNHYSLGSVGEWLFRHVAGIELDPAKPGFQHFILRPFIPAEGTLSHARATYRTMHGEIESAWKRSGSDFTWTIRIPANCTARVYVPSKTGMPIFENHLSLDRVAGLQNFDRVGDYATFTAPSGRYTFTSTL
ncbi:alpha-L-rhamnosidase [Nibricoccus aquaticus]|uniref:alpha-L-rhamnosidase n=1 Tax=Nibricoccus aquaticus TaxID=2576891 RepID=A0A290Q4B8_9BACT|nr:alpha-L-rhamnosidase [Nibricoccus aquaticus]ATC63334.1 alpha-L-rhamnosidase [Nibricoccus aquaticus]